MNRVRTVCFVLGCLAILAGYIPAVQAEDDGFGGRSAPAAAVASDRNSVASPQSGLANERIYQVNKKVTDFPSREDLSTPEAAYATIRRATAAEGDAAWLRLSSPEIMARMAREGSRAGSSNPPTEEEAQRYLNAEILEVDVRDENHAKVIARMPGKGRAVELRSLQRVGGRWLNDGGAWVDTVEQAHKMIAQERAYEAAERLRDNRPPVADPAAHLRPFVEFLKEEAQEPQQFLLEAIGKHRLVILGEVHNRPRYWAFNAALVRSPEFARRAGVIYLELPSNDQPLVDRFLAAGTYDPEPVIDMLRDMMEAGWPDQPTLDFFRTVWEVNQTLSQPQRLRIVLADMARPWREIQKREDWGKYHVDRDQYMAENIVRDLQEHAADKRHALFIVGYMHAMVNLTQPDGEPVKSAGWHLREKLGEANVFAIFPHSPVITNSGEVHGRIALGLFETAFARLGNKPMAFPLDHGPFGQQLFDADFERLTGDPFAKGCHAYLYLGPVEDEILSPLIPGFYTDEFTREVDRRRRMMYGKGLVEDGLIEHLDGASYTALRSQGWGQPHRGWSADSLGPLDAWQYGSHYQDAMRKRVSSPQATTGKVIQLYDVSSGRESLACLATGTVMVPDPNRFRGDDFQGRAWLREKGIDLVAYARTDNGNQGVVGYDMVAVKIDNNRFDTLDAQEAQQLLEKSGKQGKKAPVAMMSTKRALPVTYVIRTREGAVGVVRIEDARVSEKPAFFRLRYKLFK